MTNKSNQHVVIIGGGIIGAFCGWYLHKAGHQVTIVDKGKFGGACSHGNCGFVSPSHVLPLPQPGAIRGAISDLVKPNSPFCIRMKWSPALWRWLWNFARRCNHKDMIEAAHGRSDLLQSSQALYKEFLSNENIECEWKENGLLFVYQNRHHFEAFEKTNNMLRDTFGVSAEPISSEQLSAFEPALRQGLGGGWYYRGDCHLRPDLLMHSLRKTLESVGVEIVEHVQIDKFLSEGNRCVSVQNDGTTIEGQVFVVASGAWSPFLNDELGCKLPIQPGKGYSITMPKPTVAPSVPLVFEEHRVAITPMENKYRIGSTMEFAGYDPTINRKRLNLLKSSAEIYLQEPYCDPIEEEWFGWRPMTWDGKPIIDRSPSLTNVWIATGHNMLGVSMATGTGKLISELVGGQKPHLKTNHYSLSRLHRR